VDWRPVVDAILLGPPSPWGLALTPTYGTRHTAGFSHYLFIGVNCRLRLGLLAVFPGPVRDAGAHALEMGTDSDRCFALLDTDVVAVRRWRPIFSSRLTGNDCRSE
jgi:hypothetical protein